MKKKLLTLIAIAILLSSCASGGYWTKSGFNHSSFMQDSKECTINVMIADEGNYITKYKLDKNVKLCLEAKGYYKASQ